MEDSPERSIVSLRYRLVARGNHLAKVDFDEVLREYVISGGQASPSCLAELTDALPPPPCQKKTTYATLFNRALGLFKYSPEAKIAANSKY